MAALRAPPISTPASGTLAKGTLVEVRAQAANLKEAVTRWGALSPVNDDAAGARVEAPPNASGAPSGVAASTDETQVALQWDTLTSLDDRGGASAVISSYQLQWASGASADPEAGPWAVLVGVTPISLATSFTVCTIGSAGCTNAAAHDDVLPG